MSTTIRIDAGTLELLKQLEEQTGDSKKNILKQALNKFQRDKIIDDLNAYYKALREDPELWKEELAEREIWESASRNDQILAQRATIDP